MRLLCLLGVVCLISANAGAQIKLPGGGGIKIDLGSGLDNLFKPESPITTSPKDIFEGIHALDGWNPDLKVLTNADKTDGKWILQPGAYRLTLHGFCGRGYASGPNKGMGYGVAPWKGKQADLVQKLVRNYDGAVVSQHDAQLLIWSILARVKPSKMNSHMQAQLALLLEPKDIARLEGFSLDSLNDEMMGKLQGKVDESMRPFYEAENRFRGMMYQAEQNFGDIEKLMVPVDESLASSINQGRWIPHPNGYYFRYIPHGYDKFDYEVVVPREPKVTRDAKGRITRVETPDGYVSEVTYEDSVEPMKMPDEPNLVAYAVKKIHWEAPGEMPGDPIRTADTEVQTCILKGRYSGKSKSSTLAALDLMNIFASVGVGHQGGWFGHARDAYRTGRGLYDDYNSAQDWYQRAGRVRDGNYSYDGVLDMGHYRDGLREAASGGGIGWIAETHARIAEAVMAASQQINRLGGTRIDPTDGIGMPGNPAGQRELMSNRSF